MGVPRPGAKFGPCEKGCNHRDCAELRQIAAAICSYCLEPIGFDEDYVKNGDGFAHTVCVEDGGEA